MSISDDIGALEFLLILAGIALLGWGAYEAFNSLGLDLKPGAADPGGGAPGQSVLANLENQTLEIGNSSLSFSDAQAEVFSDPIGSVKSIVSGWFSSD